MHVKSGGKSHNGDGGQHRRSGRSLQLVRVEPVGPKALNLVFRSGGEEHAWRLEDATVTEFLALLLGGQMRSGRRVLLPDAELTLEPPATADEGPSFRLAAGPMEVCCPVDRAGLKALKADIERSLKG